MEIQEQLRIEHRKVGNTAPLLMKAADQIDRLEAQIGPLQARIRELEQAIVQMHGIAQGTLRHE
jgi:prefoldin subunit 5